MSDDERIGTPWVSQKRSVAPRSQAIPPEVAEALPKGPPPRPGRLPGQGRPPTEGVPPERGIPPEQGLLPGQGKLPGIEGQRSPGEPGQVLRGTPGQMDPGAENPWAPGEGWEDDWRPPAPPTGALDEPDDFHLQHPNFMGADED